MNTAGSDQDDARQAAGLLVPFPARVRLLMGRTLLRHGRER